MSYIRDFLEALGDHKVLCAELTYHYDGTLRDDIKAQLPMGYSQEEYEKFLSILEYQCSGGYVNGTVWLNDDKWMHLIYHDSASQEWRIFETPKIPDYLTKNQE